MPSWHDKSESIPWPRGPSANCPSAKEKSYWRRLLSYMCPHSGLPIFQASKCFVSHLLGGRLQFLKHLSNVVTNLRGSHFPCLLKTTAMPRSHVNYLMSITCRFKFTCKSSPLAPRNSHGLLNWQHILTGDCAPFFLNPINHPSHTRKTPLSPSART